MPNKQFNVYILGGPAFVRDNYWGSSYRPKVGVGVNFIIPEFHLTQGFEFAQIHQFKAYPSSINTFTFNVTYHFI